ncbi:hypothetical protein CJP16_06540 [Aeromonas sobria]|uniref:Glycosyl transferase family 1 domain-containing protein n=1 Tax=Aeromonas sobria TaxID=646 RepID=A0A2N3J3M4_AERSO|nr:glycosyltransferase [Aeromonas sobria]PKQ80444.1 hypothetical protein CJP16_06540 [Aeromonas sobria]
MKKNILILSPTGISISGVDKTLEHLVTSISGEHNVSIIMPDMAVNTPFFLDHNVDVITHTIPWHVHIGINDEQFYSDLLTRTHIINFIRKVIVEKHIDLVVTNTTVVLDGAIASVLENVPHYFHMHALFVDEIYVNLSKHAKDKIYNFIAASSTIIFVSEKLKTEFFYKVRILNKYVVIKNAIDTSCHQLNEDGFFRKNIVILGHYNDNKNQMLAIEIARHLSLIQPDVKFNFFGHIEKDYYDALCSNIDKYALSSNVTLSASIDNVPEYLSKQASILLSTSKTETFPVSFLEAMASGIPIVSTKSNGAIEILSDNQDLLFEHDDIEGISNKIHQLLSSHDYYNSISARLHDDAIESYGIERYFREFNSLINHSHFQEPVSLECIIDLYKPSLMDKKILFISPGENITSHYLLGAAPASKIKQLLGAKVDVASGMKIYECLKEKYDAIYVIRSYHTELRQLLEVYKNTINANVCINYIIDDNYFSFNTSTLQHEANLNNDEFSQMFSFCDNSLVFSNELFIAASKFSHCVRKVKPPQVVFNALNYSKENVARAVKIGYMGSLNKGGDFTFLIPVLKRILRERDNVSIEFLGFIPEGLEGIDKVSAVAFNGNYYDFINHFHALKWDVALSPLKNTSFNRSKTNNKYREYAAAGYPGVYSNVTTYRRSVVNGMNGLIADNTEDSWYHAIISLLDNRDLRNIIRCNAYKDVIEKYPLELLVIEYFLCINTRLNDSLELHGTSIVNHANTHAYKSEADNIIVFPASVILPFNGKVVKRGEYLSYFVKCNNNNIFDGLRLIIGCFGRAKTKIRVGLEVVISNVIVMNTVYNIELCQVVFNEVNILLGNSLSIISGEVIEFRLFSDTDSFKIYQKKFFISDK